MDPTQHVMFSLLGWYARTT